MKNYSFKFTFSLPERPKFSATDILLKVSNFFVGTVSAAFAVGGAYFGFNFCPFYMTSHIGNSDNGNNFFNALACFVVGLILGAAISVLSVLFLSYMAEAKASAKIIAKDKEIIKAYEAEKAADAKKTAEADKVTEFEDVFSTMKPSKVENIYEAPKATETEKVFEAEESDKIEKVEETDYLDATRRFIDLDRTVIYHPSTNFVA